MRLPDRVLILRPLPAAFRVAFWYARRQPFELFGVECHCGTYRPSAGERRGFLTRSVASRTRSPL